MTDREERQHVIEVLQKMVDWMQEIDDIATPERIHALFYAIASIKTDLKYDLLYEETSGHADKAIEALEQEDITWIVGNDNVQIAVRNMPVDMMQKINALIGNKQESTTKDNLAVDAISRQAINGYIDYILSHGMGKKKSFDFIKKFVANLPPTTSQEPCKDCISRQALIDWLKNWTLGDATPLIDFVNSMPPVTPQLSSGLEKNSKKLEKDFGESDCISRQATVKRLCNLAEFMNEHKEKSGAPYIMAALFIQDNKTEFPPVTPQEPRKGHWMGDSYGYICSNCEHSLNDLAQSMDYISFSKPKYCPNCGAKMIEPQESEDKEQTDDKDNN